MRRVAGLLSIVTLGALAAPAAAAPPGNGLTTEEFLCTGMGQTTITHSDGASAYIGDQHYVVASFAFTPTGGTADTSTLGKKAGLSGAVTCTQEQEGGTLTVVLLPAPPGT